MERRGQRVDTDGLEAWPTYLCPIGTPEDTFERCWLTGYDP